MYGFTSYVCSLLDSSILCGGSGELRELKQPRRVGNDNVGLIIIMILCFGVLQVPPNTDTFCDLERVS